MWFLMGVNHKMLCDCVWCSQGICTWDVSRPGELVPCKPEGCKDFDPRMVPKDYQKGG